MGYTEEIHEKTDKCGTWSYHSVDGWYLATSPEHSYHTHKCYVKSTHSEQLSDTVELQHKLLTNLTVSHANKIYGGHCQLHPSCQEREHQRLTIVIKSTQ